MRCYNQILGDSTSEAMKMVTLFLMLFKVVRRLRERGEPIRLFGESDQEAAKRLK